MKGALLILAVTVIVGIVLYLADRRGKESDGRGTGEGESSSGETEGMLAGTGPGSIVEGKEGGEEVCCGMHAVCEKTTLMPLSPDVVYYDDEELDRFRGREAASYDAIETEEFRDVLMTLLPEDVAGWSRSIQLRGIELPAEVRDELLMIVSDLRR